MKILLIILTCMMFFSCQQDSKYVIKDNNGKKYYTNQIYNWDKNFNCVTFWDLDINGVGKKTKICDCYTIIENKK